MTAPNILQVTTILGKTDVLNVTTTPTAITSNAAASGKVYKVNCVVVANVNGTNPGDVTIDLYRGGVAYRLVNTISVVNDSTLIAIGRDYPLYLEEGDDLRLTASANSYLTAVCSYEVIS
jgi:hypothetical protein